MRTCSTPGCLNKHQAKNMCLKHYTAWYRNTPRGAYIESEQNKRYQRARRLKAKLSKEATQ